MSDVRVTVCTPIGGGWNAENIYKYRQSVIVSEDTYKIEYCSRWKAHLTRSLGWNNYYSVKLYKVIKMQIRRTNHRDFFSSPYNAEGASRVCTRYGIALPAEGTTGWNIYMNEWNM